MRREWLAQQSRIRRREPCPPGTGFLDAETGPPKSAERDNELPQRLKRRRIDSGNPGTNGLPEPDGKIPGSAGLGWWRMQLSETGLQRRNREFSEKFRPKQAYDVLVVASQPNLDRNPNRLHES